MTQWSNVFVLMDAANLQLVIPAKAGIHKSRQFQLTINSKLFHY